MGCDLEVVQVRLQAVGAGDSGNRLIAGVHDDVFALAEAELEHAPPPPGEHALSLVCLHAEVLGMLAPAHFPEPFGRAVEEAGRLEWIPAP